MKTKSVLLLAVLSVICFAMGWVGSTFTHRGQQAHGCVHGPDFSALAYLQKGEVPSACWLLFEGSSRNQTWSRRTSMATGNCGPHRPDAAVKWFAAYDRLRSKLPEGTRGPVDGDFDTKLNAVLQAATAKAGTPQ